MYKKYPLSKSIKSAHHQIASIYFIIHKKCSSDYVN